MANEPIQSGPYPVPIDPPDGPNQMSAIVSWAAGRLVMRFASTAARDAAIPSPTDGMECWTGTTRWARISGEWADVTPWTGAWTTYTPTITGPATVNYGTGASRAGRYQRVGKLITGTAQIFLGAGAAFSAGDWSLSLPAATRAGGVQGSVWMFSAAGLNHLGALTTAGSSSSALIRPHGASYVANATNPWTWANGFSLSLAFNYEAA